LSIALLFIGTGLKAQTWDERPEATYDTEYSQEFNPTAGWDRFIFYGQWNTLMPGVFNSPDISSGPYAFFPAFF